MNISVNFNADVPLEQFGHRIAQTQLRDNKIDAVSASLGRDVSGQQEKEAAVFIPAATERASDYVASPSNTKLQVNNSDYRIKMLIERPAGNTTMQTVLNFYRILPDEQPAPSRHDIDLMA